MSDLYQDAAEALGRSSSTVAVTGAGISVESGIPDFRSPDGLWARYPPEEYATIDAFLADPDKAWVMFYELADMIVSAEPNAGHLALAQLESSGRLDAVITQNIDGLHVRAGNKDVIEFHGSTTHLSCPDCARRSPMDLSRRDFGAPRCQCGGAMKPDVVLFGEMIPPDALMRSQVLAQQCDALIVVGTSAQVFPAAGLPYTAKENGAFIIECNTEPTAFTHAVTNVFLEGPAGETLPRLVAMLGEEG